MTGEREGRRPSVGFPTSPGAVLFLFLFLFLALGPVASLSAQDSPLESPVPNAEIRAAAAYLDLDGPEGASMAVEFTFLDSSPRFWRIGAIAGLMVSQRAQVYGYGGLQTRVPLAWGLALRPSLAAGLYSPGGGRELGSPLEFRSGVALERHLAGGVRLSVFGYHLSNAGLGSRNPGLEGLGLGASVPIRP